MKKMKICIFLMMVSISANVFSQHIDISKLDSALIIADNLIETNPRIFFKNVESLIVYSGGAIKFEKYYHGTDKDSLHLIQSQTKSIVALLMGIAIDKGFVKSENELVSQYFPEIQKAGDSLYQHLTIRDVLTMSAGFEWEEMIPFEDPENDNMNMNNSGNYLQYVLSKPIVEKPNSEFNYNSGCPVIVAGIIERSAKMSLERFAEKYLFGPLDISEFYWIKDSTGFCHAGGGLFLKPADMLKIGVLVMNHGKWENQQVISENWINKATQPYLPTTFDSSSYGYFWWVREMQIKGGLTTKVITAEGAGGQRLYIFPSYQLVIAFTEHNYTTPLVSPLFINESILPILE